MLNRQLIEAKKKIENTILGVIKLWFIELKINNIEICSRSVISQWGTHERTIYESFSVDEFFWQIYVQLFSCDFRRRHDHDVLFSILCY